MKDEGRSIRIDSRELCPFVSYKIVNFIRCLLPNNTPGMNQLVQMCYGFSHCEPPLMRRKSLPWKSADRPADVPRGIIRSNSRIFRYGSKKLVQPLRMMRGQLIDT